MKIRKSVILFLMIIMSGIIFNNTYALMWESRLDTIEIKNVNEEDNIYILLKDKIENFNTIEFNNYYSPNYNDFDKKPIERINKNVVFIEERYVKNKLPKELKDTKQKIKIQENNFIKIKVSKDITIAWLENSSEYDAMKENVLIAKVDNNKVNIIDISDVKEIIYINEGRRLGTNLGRNFISRKAMEYDVISDKLIDITTEKVKKEEQFVIERAEKDEKIYESLPRLSLIMFIVLVIIIIFAIISKNIKKKKR